MSRQFASQGPAAGAGPSSQRAAAIVKVEPVQKMAFIQAFMAKGFMNETDAKKLLRSISGARDDSQYSSVVSEINRDMAFARLQLKTVRYPVDQIKWVGFVNTFADEPSKQGSQLSQQQREFFRLAMERIAHSSDGDAGSPYVSEMALLNLDVGASLAQAAATQAGEAGASQAAAATAASKRLSKAEMKHTLDLLMHDGWLHSIKPGYYTLGPRSFLELGDMLLAMEDLPEATREAWQELL